MALQDKTLKICNCNRTIPLDAQALAAALKTDAPVTVHSELCRRQAGAFQAALGASELLVACTQEAPLFAELAAAADSKADLRFVNIRETAGWSAEGGQALPKIAALLAAAALPDPEPVPNVEYKSAGRMLVIGPSAAALEWTRRLSDGSYGAIEASALLTRGEGGELPAERGAQIWSGKPVQVSGYLGAFEVRWSQDNPIDLERCTRCNACIDACPEAAIDFTYQVDLGKCKSHRRCVAACEAIGAVDFARSERARSETFDLVLDLSETPLVRSVDLPQGYAAPGADPLEQALAAGRLAQLVGEFEKPRFFRYKERICAHGRSGKTGCRRCLDTCSTGAIESAGDTVRVEPHLCAGCGGCATVCPSGALGYAYPSVEDMGLRLKALLGAYAEAGGREACLAFHDAKAGRALLHGVGRHATRGGRGLPARVIPVEVHHVAAIGIDLLLGALCYGACQVIVVAGEDTPESYRVALAEQMGFAQAILAALGYSGGHFQLVQPDGPRDLEALLWRLAPGSTVARPAGFNLSADKRTALDFVLGHLAKHAPTPRETIDLPARAPFGSLEINKTACTLCKSCIGACPEGALLDVPEAPALRFIEWNCVQCGLCAATCPEDAIRLAPRLLLGARAKQAVTLHEAEPFHCVRCGKPFSTRQMVDAMLGKLSGHSMFQGAGLRRLQMCGDCRVVDMMDNKAESTIFDFRGKP